MQQQDTPGQTGKRRALFAKFMPWFRVVWVAWWALTCACVGVVLFVNSGDDRVDWTVVAGVIALAVAALPFGLFIVGRVERTLNRADPAAAGDQTRHAEAVERDGRVLRRLTGLFGLVCIGSGLFAGFNGKLYSGGAHGENIRTIETPIGAWVVGGVFILIGLALLSVWFSKPTAAQASSDKQSDKTGGQ